MGLAVRPKKFLIHQLERILKMAVQHISRMRITTVKRPTVHLTRAAECLQHPNAFLLIVPCHMLHRRIQPIQRISPNQKSAHLKILLQVLQQFRQIVHIKLTIAR